MWDNNGDWTYTSSAVAVVAKNIKDAGATVTLKTGAKTEYTGKAVSYTQLSGFSFQSGCSEYVLFYSFPFLLLSQFLIFTFFLFP